MVKIETFRIKFKKKSVELQLKTESKAEIIRKLFELINYIWDQ